VLELLVQNGADLNARTRNNETPYGMLLAYNLIKLGIGFFNLAGIYCFLSMSDKNM
jgi:hypothetical protein